MKNNNSKITFVIIALALVVILFGAYRERKAKSDDMGSSSKQEYKSLVGKPAPQFSLVDRDGKEYTNETLKGKNVVLFFNEGLACYPACWDEMIEISKDSRLNNENTIALSVVIDSEENWKTATEKMAQLGSVNVAFDRDSIASKDFYMTTAPSSMHGGVPGHSYVVLDKEGVVRYVLDDPKMGKNSGKIYTEILKLK